MDDTTQNPPSNPLSNAGQVSNVTTPPAAFSMATKSFIRTMERDIQAVKEGRAPQRIETQIPSVPLASSAAEKIPDYKLPPAPSSLAEAQLGKLEKRFTPLTGWSKEEKREEKKVEISLPSPEPSSVKIETEKPQSPPDASVYFLESLKTSPPPEKNIPEFRKPEPQKETYVMPAEPSDAGKPQPFLGVGIRQMAANPLFRFLRLNAKKIVISLALIVVVVGGYWFFVLRSPGDHKVFVTPEPTFSTSPELSKLYTFFSSRHTLLIPSDTISRISLEPSLVDISFQDKGKNILINPYDERGKKFNFSRFFEQFLLDYPANLLSFIDQDDFDLILSRQTEKFNEQGKPTKDTRQELRVAFAVRVVNFSQTKEMMINWEDNLRHDLESFFEISGDRDGRGFSETSYRDVPVRYLNVSFPDRSVDYTLLTALDGDDYLVIANSREQTFSIIDNLLGHTF